MKKFLSKILLCSCLIFAISSQCVFALRSTDPPFPPDSAVVDPPFPPNTVIVHI